MMSEQQVLSKKLKSFKKFSYFAAFHFSKNHEKSDFGTESFLKMSTLNLTGYSSYNSLIEN